MYLFHTFWCGRHALTLLAYLEFFISPSLIKQLIARIGDNEDFTYYAVNKAGDLSTNSPSNGPVSDLHVKIYRCFKDRANLFFSVERRNLGSVSREGDRPANDR